MAESNGTQLASKIEAAAKKARKLQKDKDLIDLINELDNLRKESASYNGEIARVCPSTLQAQIDVLVGIFRQLQMNAKTTETALLNLVNFVDKLPNGEFRKKLIDDSDEEAEGPDLNDGILPPQSIDTTPDTSTGPQSAVLGNNPSYNESLSDYYKRDFNNGASFREARQNSAFSFDRISNDLDRAGFDFDFTNQNANSSFPVPQSYAETTNDVSNAVASSFGQNKLKENVRPTALNMRSIMSSIPSNAGDIAGGSTKMVGLNESFESVVDNMWNSNEKIAAKNPDIASGFGMDDSDLNECSVVNDE